MTSPPSAPSTDPAARWGRRPDPPAADDVGTAPSSPSPSRRHRSIRKGPIIISAPKEDRHSLPPRRVVANGKPRVLSLAVPYWSERTRWGVKRLAFKRARLVAALAAMASLSPLLSMRALMNGMLPRDPLDAPPPRSPFPRYTLRDVLAAGDAYESAFAALVYDPRGDEFAAYQPARMRWGGEDRDRLSVVAKALADALRVMFPRRFRASSDDSAREFAVAVSSGTYPHLRRALYEGCVRRRLPDCVVPDTPVLQFSPAFAAANGTAFRNAVAMPPPDGGQLGCFVTWATRREVCGRMSTRAPGDGGGPGLLLGGGRWDDLIPQAVWRGADAGYLSGIATDISPTPASLRRPDLELDIKKRVDLLAEWNALAEKEGDESMRFNASSAPWAAYEELLPRWRAVLWTTEAEFEARRDGGSGSRGTTLPWADLKFTHAFHGGTKMPTDEIEFYNQLLGYNVSAIGEPMSLEALAKYRYHVDLGGEGGTAGLSTLAKLGLPGLLFHHTTPTVDYFHDRMKPWVHFVPIQSNLRDLKEKYLWARNNTREAEAISRRGTALAQAFASDFGATFEEYFGRPLRMAVEAYAPLAGNESLREAVGRTGGGWIPVLSCGGRDADDCEDLVAGDRADPGRRYRADPGRRSGPQSAPSDVARMIQDNGTRMRPIPSAPPNEEAWLLSPGDVMTPSNEIPRVINKLYFENDGQFEVSVDANLRKAHDSWTIMNPGYQVRYFDLSTTRRYLQQFFHPVFLRAFDCLESFAIKADFARVAILYREGGWHSDWKHVCLQQNLLDSISSGTNFFAAKDEGAKGCIQNAFIGASPRHGTLGKYLKLLLTHTQQRIYGSSPIHPTGPCAFGQVVDSNQYSLLGAYRHLVEGSSSYSEGGAFYWKGQMIILHKCKGCGEMRDWRAGNNYNVLWKNRNFYCEDAPSIFQA